MRREQATDRVPRFLARNAGLRELLTALLISEAGTWIAYVALTVAVYAKTGSPAWVSALLLVGFAPNVLLAPSSASSRIACRGGGS